MPSTQAEKYPHLRRAAARLDALKLAAGCVDCGYNKHPAALHFDHRDPETKLKALGWEPDTSRLHTRARLERYVTHVTAYCDVRCASCHAERTAAARQYTSTPRREQKALADTLW